MRDFELGHGKGLKAGGFWRFLNDTHSVFITLVFSVYLVWVVFIWSLAFHMVYGGGDCMIPKEGFF